MPHVVGKLEQAPARDITVDRKKDKAGGCCDGLATYVYRLGLHEFRIKRHRIEPSHVAAFCKGEAEFALVVEEPVVVLCARLGDAIPWTAAVYAEAETTRGPDSIPPPPESSQETRALLNLTLADAASGLTVAERNVTLWLDFSRALSEAIRERTRLIVHPVEHDRALARLRRRYPADAMLAASAAVRCFGSL